MTALILESVCAQLDIGWMTTRAKNTSRARLTLFIKPLLLTNCFASTFSCRGELSDTLLRRCLDRAAPTELLREPQVQRSKFAAFRAAPLNSRICIPVLPRPTRQL